MAESYFIRVNTDGQRWVAAVVINGVIVSQGEARITKEDPISDGTAITLALLDFHQKIGQDIRRG